MLNRTTLVSAALLLAGVPFAGGAFAPREEVLSARDQESLGKAVGEWLQARKSNEKVAEALEELNEALEKAKKKAKVDDPLALIEDLEAAFYHAVEYSDRNAKKGKVEEYAEKAGDATFKFAVWVPKSYRSSDGPYPLIIAIPNEEDKTPKAHIDDAWMDNDLRDNFIIAAVEMPGTVSEWPILGEGFRGGVAQAMRTLGWLSKNLAIDADRTFLAGSGNAGVDAAVAIAARYPSRFAGVVGRAGDMNAQSAVNFRSIPTLFAGGGANCTAFAEESKKLGHENSTIDPDATLTEVGAWLRQQERDSYPAHVSYAPAGHLHQSAYWLKVDRFEPGKARVDAKVDRASNTIEIEGEHIGTVIVSFNDALVDMSKPIRVVCNGTVHEQVLGRNLEMLLTLYYNSGDPGGLYTNFGTYDLPAPAKASDGTAEAGGTETGSK